MKIKQFSQTEKMPVSSTENSTYVPISQPNCPINESQQHVPNSSNATSTLVSQEGILGGGSGGGLKTSIKQVKTQTTTFKGINIDLKVMNPIPGHR